MSYAVFFGVLSATCLVGALAALWGSLRAALGGQSGDTGSGAVDAPERATLLDEKASLLRAIKDLHYEHQVGKLDVADFERLDRAYRARAKEVLELLDRDVRPYRARAEALLGSTVPAGSGVLLGRAGAVGLAGRGGKTAKKKGGKPSAGAAHAVAPSAAGEPLEVAAPSGEALVDQLDALSPEKRAQAEAFLAQLAAEARASAPEEPSDDEGDDADDEGDDAHHEEGASRVVERAPRRDEEDEEDEEDEPKEASS